ncbi:MAG: dihydroorotate dehydrogenase-like protein [Chloroflexi bacterium]|nr:dihydroorotate dehydrogenase-like protein [Chloroflexota bacterium]MBK6711036.1 dihydroorotate dehydrogenase-like protein [Chloroflexota bacterium]MBK7177969.1 dihydroorotate dehydrogenase-like protein [Chloroflexota bacterium]MBK7916089.1 dihydroorotate dehydrogenase-like protein [Chloroflexota bacterium]MBK8930928.1 dihydroorotate dehydrogenase-like protein [Chloroflexota bacterium]
MDLTTTYLGMKLKNPLVPSSSPLMRSLDNLRWMEDAGASAVVLHSLFEEQITMESHTLNHYLTQGVESFPEALSYFPEASEYKTGPVEYLEHIQKAKTSLGIPVIASLNGVSTGGWVNYARQIQEAGADALELNVYYIPTDPNLTGSEVEQIYLDVIKDVKSAINIPVAMKLNPYFSALANMARRLADGGADGLVLFNRFYQPDLDLETLEVVPNLKLSTSTELRLPLRWIAILYGRVNADLALTTGVHTVSDVLKAVAAGADITMLASELLRNGINRLKVLSLGMEEWLIENEYESLSQLKGSLSQINCAEPAAFERANYMRVLSSYAPDYPWRMEIPTGD